MPKYFFDVDENGVVSRDDTGLDLPDLDSAIMEAKVTLPAVARETARGAVCQSEALKVGFSVRDAGGDVLFEATLQMQMRQFL